MPRLARNTSRLGPPSSSPRRDAAEWFSFVACWLALATVAFAQEPPAPAVRSTTEWRALLEDPATRSAAAAQLSRHPLPDGLDPRPYTTDPCVLATWAEGQPERIAWLVDALAEQRQEALDALLLLQPDLRSVQARFAPVSQHVPVPQWWQQNRDALRRMMPEAAAEWRIVASLPPTMSGCGPHPGQRTRLALPADGAMLAAIERRLSLGPISRGQAFEMLMLLDTECRPLLAAFEKAIPRLGPDELERIPDVVCSFAPEAAARLCEPLLGHGDARVAAAALRGPMRAVRELGHGAVRVTGGAAFAKTIVKHLATPGCAGTGWFTVLVDGVEAVPDLRSALRSQPQNRALVNALADLGPAAAAALPELLLALPHQPYHATRALQAILPAGTVLPHLLPLLESGHLALIAPLLEPERVDGAALLILEHSAMHAEGDLRRLARRLLARSVGVSPVADEIRRSLLVEEPSVMSAAPAHLERLWPRLTEAERRGAVAALANAAELPSGLVDALVARIDPLSPDADAFQALVRGAPWHPRVVELVDASNRFWNRSVQELPDSRGRSGSHWFHQHDEALLTTWLRGDAALRATVLPHLHRRTEAALDEIGRAMQPQGGRFTLQPREHIQHLELIERLRHPAGAPLAMRCLHDADPPVRSAAVRAFVACAQADHTFIASVLHRALRETTWEERWGPLDGLPDPCARIAASTPSPAERAAALRAQLATQWDRPLQECYHDVPAARHLLPELREILATRSVDQCKLVLPCLRRLGTDAAQLLPAVEALAAIPALRFEVLPTARILRDEVPPESLRDPTGR